MKAVLCFGDSNTYGFNPEFTSPYNMRYPKNIRWTGILQNILGNDYDIIEEGLGGRTTVWDDPPSYGRNGRTQIIPLLQSHQPIDLVVIMLGTNDVKRVYNASVMEVGRGMEELVKICLNPYVYDIMKAPEILIISPVKLGKNLKNSWLCDIFDEDSPSRVEGLASTYKQIADKYKTGFMDAAQYVETSDVDSVHINMEGHRILAIEIAKKVKEMTFR